MPFFIYAGKIRILLISSHETHIVIYNNHIENSDENIVYQSLVFQLCRNLGFGIILFKLIGLELGSDAYEMIYIIPKSRKALILFIQSVRE